MHASVRVVRDSVLRHSLHSYVGVEAVMYESHSLHLPKIQ